MSQSDTMAIIGQHSFMDALRVEEGQILHKVWSYDQILRVAKAGPSRYSDLADRERIKAILDDLLASGDYRIVKQLPIDWKQKLKILGDDFPNFHRVVAYLERIAHIADAGSKIFSPSPILLVGDAGLGKTAFAKRLGTFIGSDFKLLSMESSQCSSALVGSADYWANSKPGLLFGLLSGDSFCNPLIFLDEIDKVEPSSNGNSPSAINALYTILEPETSSTFTDNSIPSITFDASKIMYVASANSLADLPAPILSRFMIFNIDQPSKSELRKITVNMFASLVQDLGFKQDAISLSECAFQELLNYSPRVIKRLLKEAIGEALKMNRRRVQSIDIQKSSETPQKKKSIGFR